MSGKRWVGGEVDPKTLFDDGVNPLAVRQALPSAMEALQTTSYWWLGPGGGAWFRKGLLEFGGLPWLRGP